MVGDRRNSIFLTVQRSLKMKKVSNSSWILILFSVSFLLSCSEKSTDPENNNELDERTISGSLTGNLSDISQITATVTGDGIDSSNPLVSTLAWFPQTNNYNGFINIPSDGNSWQVEVRVIDSAGHSTGYYKLDFDKSSSEVPIPEFDAKNALPSIHLQGPAEVSINDTINFMIKFSQSDLTDFTQMNI